MFILCAVIGFAAIALLVSAFLGAFQSGNGDAAFERGTIVDRALQSLRPSEAGPDRAPEPSRARIWTHADGRRVEARLIGTADDHITIQRTSDQRTFTIDVYELCEADRDYVRRWRAGAP